MRIFYKNVWSEMARTSAALGEPTESKEQPSAALQAHQRPLRSVAQMRALEQRFMFDGAAVVDAAHALPDATQTALIPEVSAPVVIRQADASLNNGKKEVAFVDTSVANYKALEAGIQNGIEIVEIDGSKSGLAQIAQWAETHTGFDAAHILSHGADGTIYIGSDTITNTLLQSETAKAELAELGHALKSNGDLLIYGCNVATSQKGQGLIANLSAATGADVAASNDATGAANRGGDWALEISTGAIETSAISATGFGGLLTSATFDFESGVTGYGTKTVEQLVGGETLKIVVINGNTQAWQQATYTAGLSINGSESLSYGLDTDQNITAITFELTSGNSFDLSSLKMSEFNATTETVTLTSSKGTASFSLVGGASGQSLDVAGHANAAYFQGIDSFILTVADGTLAASLDDIQLTNISSPGPTVTDAKISISGASGTGGAYKIGDTVTATWNNTAATGDNNSGITGVTMDFSQFGGSSAVAATNVSGTWTASYTIVAGAIDATSRNVSVTATTASGSTTTADSTNATVDNIAPTVTDAKISISGASGTGGAFKIGDTVTATWNNTASGDNNSDTISSATVDFSAFGGGSAVTATNTSGIWTATYTIVAGSLDATSRNISFTATDNAGNTTTTADTTNATVDSVAPTVTNGNISISGGSGTGGAYKIGDTVTATWNNTAGGDNNSDTISAVTVNFSQFGGGAAVAATNSSGTWTATYTIVAGAIDATNRNISVTATDNAGNTTTTADTTNATVDNVAPTVTNGNISISGGSGTGGAYKIGDTVTATWNNTAGGDNNSDTISSVTVDFSQFGGGAAVAATNSSGTWTATYTIVAGAIDATNRNISVTATDNAGNTTTTADTTNATVDSVAPTVSDTYISISGASGTGGAYKIGDTITATWNNTAGGDNNSDTISSVTVDFSQFGGGAAVAATNSSGTWTATYTIVAGSIDATNRNISITATDNAGNTTTTADTTNATVDNVAPVMTDAKISISGGSGTGGAFIVGDTVTATWNAANTGGDGNTDSLASVTADFSQFGGGSAIAATNSSGTWTATYTIVAGAINGTTNRNVSFTATDNAGNTTTTADSGNVTVDNVTPVVSSVSVPSNNTYGTSANLDFTVNFGDNITVTTGGGTPRIALTIGSTTRYASYVSGSGTSALLFRYTTQTGDNDSDGITVGALDTNGGTLKDANGNDATLTLNSVGSTSAVLVSTNQAPVLSTPTTATYTDTSAADSFSNPVCHR
ncbi:DUF4347 domain-containing protein [Zoogloea sp.]|uniref:DUF4347 domain-containing protein n=1 Tax=Zoogloea sp. TaxID=49181 RepID=UPI0035B43B74